MELVVLLMEAAVLLNNGSLLTCNLLPKLDCLLGFRLILPLLLLLAEMHLKLALTLIELSLLLACLGLQLLDLLAETADLILQALYFDL